MDSEEGASQHSMVSKVAAVGPYIQALSTMNVQGSEIPARPEAKPSYPVGTATLPVPDSSQKTPSRPAKPASGTKHVQTLPIEGTLRTCTSCVPDSGFYALYRVQNINNNQPVHPDRLLSRVCQRLQPFLYVTSHVEPWLSRLRCVRAPCLQHLLRFRHIFLS